MNTMFFAKHVFCLSSLLTLVVLGGGSSAIAQVSPSDNTPPGQATQSQMDAALTRPIQEGGSYIGVGGNIGISGGSSPLADGNFGIVSKLSVFNSFSIRPGAVLGSDTTFLVPITYDFAYPQIKQVLNGSALPIAPYAGIGVAIKDSKDTNVRVQNDKYPKIALLLSGGVDMPLSDRITATASINAGFFRSVDIGLLFGVGYRFSGI
ncbi:hypothetical protein [Cylindrospermopsis curvispora]|nr:hypothetical protein [Cylindrospermopsis curvispora]